MKTSERRKDILSKIRNDGEVKVETLMQEYDVSVETIRRDLRILDYQGEIKRKYGGAVNIEKASEIPYVDRLIQHQLQKEAIAREAIKLLEDGDSLFVDGKTTCLAFARNIPEHLELNIVTNSIVVAQHLIEHKKNCTVFTTSGQLNEDGISTGPKFHDSLRGFHFDKAFFSAIALNSTGCFYSRAEPQQLAHLLSELSTNLILLADSSKMNKIAFLFGLDINDLDYIITDEGVDDSFVRAMESISSELIVAPME